jgi:hypothetical protein
MIAEEVGTSPLGPIVQGTPPYGNFFLQRWIKGVRVVSFFRMFIGGIFFKEKNVKVEPKINAPQLASSST